MSSLCNVLPPPQHSYTTTLQHPQPTTHNPQSHSHSQLAITQLNANIPPYGHRSGYIPREPEDFGDGGAFPEIHIKQYPLEMGRKDTLHTSSVVALKVNETGEVQYDAILRENMRKDQILHSKYSDLIPKEDTDPDTLLKPSQSKAIETADETRKALEKLTQSQIKSTRPTYKRGLHSKPVTIRYQSGTHASNPSHASGATSRLIKIYEMPTDPLDPPKFRHKKLPTRPPSPPVPIMHSPPRQVTIEDQRNWKIPPCVSNWKNNKGFTLPLHQRLAADGRGLYNHVINDKFAKFSEALLIAERQARKEVEARAQMRLKLSKKQREQKEKELAAMAKSAKEQSKYNAFVGVSSEQKPLRDSSAYEPQPRKEMSDSDSSESESESDSERRKAYEEREEIRRERGRERKRQYRLDARKTGKNNSVRQRERDISERIALGQFNGKKSTESLYDNRLFNQDSGLNAGFAGDDEYGLYDKPLWGNKQRKMYRPRGNDEEMYGLDGGDILTEESGKHKAHKGFEGAEENRGNGHRKGRFEFEKDESSESESSDGGKERRDELMEDLDRFSKAKERKKGVSHSKGYMYANAGGTVRNAEEYVASNRERVAFEVGDGGGGEERVKSGLHFTEDMRKEQARIQRDERRGDRRDRYNGKDRRRRRRSRSRSRSRSNDRYDRRKRDRKRRDENEYEDRGRWGH